MVNPPLPVTARLITVVKARMVPTMQQSLYSVVYQDNSVKKERNYSKTPCKMCVFGAQVGQV